MENKRNYLEAQQNWMMASAALAVIAKEDSDLYWGLYDARLEAEKQLFDWAKEIVKTDPKTAARFGDVEQVFTKGPKFPAIRAKLVDACMKLSA